MNLSEYSDISDKENIQRSNASNIPMGLAFSQQAKSPKKKIEAFSSETLEMTNNDETGLNVDGVSGDDDDACEKRDHEDVCSMTCISCMTSNDIEISEMFVEHPYFRTPTEFHPQRIFLCILCARKWDRTRQSANSKDLLLLAGEVLSPDPYILLIVVLHSNP